MQSRLSKPGFMERNYSTHSGGKLRLWSVETYAPEARDLSAVSCLFWPVQQDRLLHSCLKPLSEAYLTVWATSLNLWGFPTNRLDSLSLLQFSNAEFQWFDTVGLFESIILFWACFRKREMHTFKITYNWNEWKKFLNSRVHDPKVENLQPKRFQYFKITSLFKFDKIVSCIPECPLLTFHK